MRASSRGGSASLASRVFCELVASVAPLAERHGVQCGLWESLRVFLRQSGGVLKGYLKAACVVFLGTAACELDAAQADGAHDFAWCKLRPLTRRGGAKWKGSCAMPGRTGEDGVSATTSQEISGVVLKQLLPLRLPRCALSSLLPTDTVALALTLPLVQRGTLPMSVTLSRCGGCLPARNVARLAALME